MRRHLLCDTRRERCQPQLSWFANQVPANSAVATGSQLDAAANLVQHRIDDIVVIHAFLLCNRQDHTFSRLEQANMFSDFKPPPPPHPLLEEIARFCIGHLNIHPRLTWRLIVLEPVAVK